MFYSPLSGVTGRSTVRGPGLSAPGYSYTTPIGVVALMLISHPFLQKLRSSLAVIVNKTFSGRFPTWPWKSTNKQPCFLARRAYGIVENSPTLICSSCKIWKTISPTGNDSRSGGIMLQYHNRYAVYLKAVRKVNRHKFIRMQTFTGSHTVLYTSTNNFTRFPCPQAYGIVLPAAPFVILPAASELIRHTVLFYQRHRKVPHVNNPGPTARGCSIST